MRLDFEASERAANIFLAFKKLEGLTDEQLANLAGGAIPPSTLNRLLTTATSFAIGQVLPLAEVVSARLRCDVAQLLDHIVDRKEAPPVILDLLAATIYEFKEESLLELTSSLTRAEKSARLYQAFRNFPSPALLTEEIMEKLYRKIAAAFGDHAEYRHGLMMKFGRRRHSEFQFRIGKQPERTDIFISNRQIKKFLFQDLKAVGCSKDEVNALLEMWIFDCLYNRNVHFGIFDAEAVRCSTRGSAGHSHFGPYDMITLIDRRIALKRIEGKPGIMWFECSGTNTARSVIARSVSLLNAARRAVPYDMDDKQQVERALKKLLSPTTWAYRSATAMLYRSVNLN